MEALTEFLSEVDLTLSGLDAPSVRLWIERDDRGRIVGSTGYEISSDRQHALIRTHQVRLFQRTGQVGREVAWSRFLDLA